MSEEDAFLYDLPPHFKSVAALNLLCVDYSFIHLFAQ